MKTFFQKILNFFKFNEFKSNAQLHFIAERNEVLAKERDLKSNLESSEVFLDVLEREYKVLENKRSSAGAALRKEIRNQKEIIDSHQHSLNLFQSKNRVFLNG